MLLELGIGIGIAKLAGSIEKSSKIDSQALKKYGKAYEKAQEAELMVKNKSELADKRLVNVAKKKRSIIEHTFPKFVDVYGQIQKIGLDMSSVNINAPAKIDNINEKINFISLSVKKNFSDKEMVLGSLFSTDFFFFGIAGGFGKMMVKDSERYLSAARGQMRSANVVYSQAESICVVYDGIIERADRIAKLLAGLNALFIKSITETQKTIEKNGIQVKNYSEFDKGVLMTCVNFALAVADIINVPVVNEKGEIAEKSAELIETGEKYLSEMKKVIEG